MHEKKLAHMNLNRNISFQVQKKILITHLEKKSKYAARTMLILVMKLNVLQYDGSYLRKFEW